MYVDATQECNELAFQFGSTANGVGAVSQRSWSIKVSFRNFSHHQNNFIKYTYLFLKGESIGL